MIGFRVEAKEHHKLPVAASTGLQGMLWGLLNVIVPMDLDKAPLGLSHVQREGGPRKFLQPGWAIERLLLAPSMDSLSMCGEKSQHDLPCWSTSSSFKITILY